MNNKYRILIVEDEEEIRENLRIFLEYNGFQVQASCNGQEALDHLKVEKPHIVISDLIMPVMGGLQLLHELNERNMKIPFIVVSAYGTMSTAIEALKNNASDFISKPIDFDYLIQVVNKVLEQTELKLSVASQRQQIENDLKFAARIQQSLLPENVLTPYLSMHYIFRPLIDIGGDYISLYQYDEKRLALALYDVQGHGISAALTATLIHNFLQQILPECHSSSTIIRLTNQFIYKNIGELSMFITMIILYIDLENHIMTSANAGHTPLLFSNCYNDQIIKITSQNPLLGVFPEFNELPVECNTHLAKGNRIILYTDGLTEARNKSGEFWGLDALENQIKQHRNQSSIKCLSFIFNEIDDFQNGCQSDDQTMIVIDIHH